MRLALVLVAALALAARPAACDCNYIVDKTETLFEIAQGYNLTVDDILSLNQIENPDLIQIGEVVSLPCPVEETSGSSVLDLLMHRSDANILLKAIVAAGLKDFIANETYVGTFFAPTDKAFGKLFDALNATAAEVLADKNLLEAVLPYHVVPDVAAKAKDLTDKQKLPTLDDNAKLMVDLREDGSVVLKTEGGQKVKVKVADLTAGDAIVHVVDEVLLPFTADEVATPCTVTLEQDESLWAVAEKYGTTLEDILELNEFADPNMVQPGTIIKLLPEC